jgi:hypothetical protein
LSTVYPSLRGRSMAGQRVLVPFIGVRVLSPELVNEFGIKPNWATDLCWQMKSAGVFLEGAS